MRTMTRDTLDWLVHVYSLRATSIYIRATEHGHQWVVVRSLCAVDFMIRMTLYRMLGF